MTPNPIEKVLLLSKLELSFYIEQDLKKSMTPSLKALQSFSRLYQGFIKAVLQNFVFKALFRPLRRFQGIFQSILWGIFKAFLRHFSQIFAFSTVFIAFDLHRSILQHFQAFFQTQFSLTSGHESYSLDRSRIPRGQKNWA